MAYINIRPPWNSLGVDSAETLWEHFVAYTEHSDNTPGKEEKLFSTKTGLLKGQLNILRPYTIDAFMAFCGFPKSRWTTWQSKRGVEDYFLEVMEMIEGVCNDQMFQGAAMNLFNANMISRRLGLVEKTEVVNVNPAGQADAEKDLAVHIHPDDPDPLDAPRPLYSMAQIEAGVPFTAPVPPAIDNDYPSVDA